MNEMRKPFTRWHGYKNIKESLFLSALPSSWGPVYVGRICGPFIEYVKERMEYHSYEEEARFNKKSTKRERERDEGKCHLSCYNSRK